MNTCILRIILNTGSVMSPFYSPENGGFKEVKGPAGDHTTRTHGFLPPELEHLTMTLHCLQEQMVVRTGSGFTVSEDLPQATICLSKFILLFFLGTWLPTRRLNFPASSTFGNSNGAVVCRWNVSVGHVNNVYLARLRFVCHLLLLFLLLNGVKQGKAAALLW